MEGGGGGVAGGMRGGHVVEPPFLALYNARASPPANIHPILRPHPQTPPLPTRCSRRDLRGLIVCSVDPPGCKDIDDALHAR